MNKALADFAQNPMEYDLSEMMDDEEIHEMARDVEALRKELYELSLIHISTYWRKTPKPTPNIRGTAATGSTGPCRTRTATCPSSPLAGVTVTIPFTSAMTQRAKSAPCMCCLLYTSRCV